MALTDKQELFCQEYIKNLNATDAYEKAYKVKRKTADAAGARLLGNVRIQTRLGELKASRQKRTKISQDMVVREIANVAFSDIGLVCDWDAEGNLTLKSKEDMPENARKSLQSIESIKSYDKDGNHIGTRNKFRQHDKLKALELLSRHLGLLDGSGADKNNPESSLEKISAALRNIGKGRKHQ